MIYCAKCGSRVGVTGPCRTCKRWPGGFNPVSMEPLQNQANTDAMKERRRKRQSRKPEDRTP